MYVQSFALSRMLSVFDFRVSYTYLLKIALCFEALPNTTGRQLPTPVFVGIAAVI